MEDDERVVVHQPRADLVYNQRHLRLPLGRLFPPQRNPQQHHGQAHNAPDKDPRKVYHPAAIE
jgi:hypothetical protein